MGHNMRIARHGAGAYHGTVGREAPGPVISWNEDDKQIQLTAYRIRDFRTKAHHTYYISLSLSDLRGILETLATDAIASTPDTVEKKLRPVLPALVRLVAVPAGMKTGNQTNQKGD